MNKTTVEKRINKIKNRFEKNHYIFLGEEDIRCHLFSELFKKFNRLEKTIDRKKTIPLHTQISFIDEEGRLIRGEKPDIVIFDVSTCHLYSDNSIQYKDRLSKGFQFKDAPIAIEIKLNWTKRKENVIKQVKDEIKKIKKLRDRNPEIFFYIVYFDKKGRLERKDVMKLQPNNHIKIIYAKPIKFI